MPTYAVYKDIIGLLYNKFVEDSNLSTLTADAASFYHSEVPPGADMPYVVADIIDVIPIYTFGNLATPIEEARVSFFLADKAASSANISTMFDELEETYGINSTWAWFLAGLPPPVSVDYKFIESERVMFTGLERRDGVWSGIADYIIRLKKAA